MKPKIIVVISGGETGRVLEDGKFTPYNTKEIVKLSILNINNKNKD